MGYIALDSVIYMTSVTIIVICGGLDFILYLRDGFKLLDEILQFFFINNLCWANILGDKNLYTFYSNKHENLPENDPLKAL